MYKLPKISRYEDLEFEGLQQIMGVGGPWVGDMYLGAKGICKGVVKGNLVHNKSQKKLFFVQQHEDYFTINCYDIEADRVNVLDMKLMMAHIDGVRGKKMVYYEAFNDKDGRYRKSLKLDQIKHLPLPESDKPEDKPIRYKVEVSLDEPLLPQLTQRDVTVIIFVLAVFAFVVLFAAGRYQALPGVLATAMVIYGFARAFIRPQYYITRLMVINDELHVEYTEGRSNKQKVYKLVDIKVEMGIYGNSRDEYRLMIYNWKKTKYHFMQPVFGNWTSYMIEKVGKELSEFTPRTGRQS